VVVLPLVLRLIIVLIVWPRAFDRFLQVIKGLRWHFLTQRDERPGIIFARDGFYDCTEICDVHITVVRYNLAPLGLEILVANYVCSSPILAAVPIVDNNWYASHPYFDGTIFWLALSGRGKLQSTFSDKYHQYSIKQVLSAAYSYVSVVAWRHDQRYNPVAS
jgi:hypothetical protein